MVRIMSSQASIERRQEKSISKHDHDNGRMSLFDQDLFIEFVS